MLLIFFLTSFFFFLVIPLCHDFLLFLMCALGLRAESTFELAMPTEFPTLFHFCPRLRTVLLPTFEQFFVIQPLIVCVGHAAVVSIHDHSDR